MVDHNTGSTLIEVIIAVGVVALVMITVVSIITVSVRDTVLAKSKLLGTRYTQEGMEFIVYREEVFESQLPRVSPSQTPRRKVRIGS